MNPEQTPPQPHEPAYSRWQRFVNWLAGGPPDPEKIAASRKKHPTWYRRHAFSSFWLFMGIMGLFYPDIISRLNAEPELDRLQTLSVRIVQTREKDPHFDMQLPDGSVQAMEWPVKLMFFRGKRVYYWSKAQRQALVGCQATIQMAPIRWTITDRYRVWALSCPSIGFEVGVQQTAQNLKRHATSAKEILITFLISFFPLWIVFFLREKRGVL